MTTNQTNVAKLDEIASEYVDGDPNGNVAAILLNNAGTTLITDEDCQWYREWCEAHSQYAKLSDGIRNDHRDETDDNDLDNVITAMRRIVAEHKD